jgi:hypothetical protein
MRDNNVGLIVIQETHTSTDHNLHQLTNFDLSSFNDPFKHAVPSESSPMNWDGWILNCEKILLCSIQKNLENAEKFRKNSETFNECKKNINECTKIQKN